MAPEAYGAPQLNRPSQANDVGQIPNEGSSFGTTDTRPKLKVLHHDLQQRERASGSLARRADRL